VGGERRAGVERGSGGAERVVEGGADVDCIGDLVAGVGVVAGRIPEVYEGIVHLAEEELEFASSILDREWGAWHDA
jgi:hypothetical protein